MKTTEASNNNNNNNKMTLTGEGTNKNNKNNDNNDNKNKNNHDNKTNNKTTETAVKEASITAAAKDPTTLAGATPSTAKNTPNVAMTEHKNAATMTADENKNKTKNMGPAKGDNPTGCTIIHDAVKDPTNPTNPTASDTTKTAAMTKTKDGTNNNNNQVDPATGTGVPEVASFTDSMGTTLTIISTPGYNCPDPKLIGGLLGQFAQALSGFPKEEHEQIVKCIIENVIRDTTRATATATASPTSSSGSDTDASGANQEAPTNTVPTGEVGTDAATADPTTLAVSSPTGSIGSDTDTSGAKEEEEEEGIVTAAKTILASCCGCFTGKRRKDTTNEEASSNKKPRLHLPASVQDQKLARDGMGVRLAAALANGATKNHSPGDPVASATTTMAAIAGASPDDPFASMKAAVAAFDSAIDVLRRLTEAYKEPHQRSGATNRDEHILQSIKMAKADLVAAKERIEGLKAEAKAKKHDHEITQLDRLLTQMHVYIEWCRETEQRYSGASSPSKSLRAATNGIPASRRPTQSGTTTWVRRLTKNGTTEWVRHAKTTGAIAASRDQHESTEQDLLGAIRSGPAAASASATIAPDAALVKVFVDLISQVPKEDHESIIMDVASLFEPLSRSLNAGADVSSLHPNLVMELWKAFKDVPKEKHEAVTKQVIASVGPICAICCDDGEENTTKNNLGDDCGTGPNPKRARFTTAYASAAMAAQRGMTPYVPGSLIRGMSHEVWNSLTADDKQWWEYITLSGRETISQRAFECENTESARAMAANAAQGLSDDDQKFWGWISFLGKEKIVLYFYPRGAW